MQLSEIEREQLYAIVEKYDHHPDVQRMREYIQHGSMTVHNHCMDVARCSLIINKKLGLNCNKHDLIRGALLHDYFLYDWHVKDKSHRLHG